MSTSSKSKRPALVPFTEPEIVSDDGSMLLTIGEVFVDRKKFKQRIGEVVAIDVRPVVSDGGFIRLFVEVAYRQELLAGRAVPDWELMHENSTEDETEEGPKRMLQAATLQIVSEDMSLALRGDESAGNFIGTVHLFFPNRAMWNRFLITLAAA